MRKFEIILRIMIAIVIGELLLVLGTTLVQELIFSGIGWGNSSKFELLAIGLGSFLAAVASGAVAFLIVKQATGVPNMILSILVILETVWLIKSGSSEEPIWFSGLAGALLILGIWVGRILVAKLRIPSKT
ncbi:hypothetical protein ACFO5O_01700 [Geojedonia litorea]|uniref:Uncharacterized protein n=2 Tax=Geojedonia litorea TaxID=1268269 RepID=A0ABV9N0E5_9FLAO